MVKNRRQPQPTASENLRSKVQTWLMDMGYSVQTQSDPGALWILLAEQPNSFRFAVVHPTRATDAIALQAGLDISPEHQSQVSMLESAERLDFLWNLRFALLATGLEFTGVDDAPKRIDVTTPIFLDALSKDTFVYRATKVRNALFLVQWSYVRATTGGDFGGLGFNSGPIN